MTMSKSVTGLGQTVQEKTYFGGKPYAGVLLNARPYVEAFPRCIVGFLKGEDLAGRGFDNRTVHTSTVVINGDTKSISTVSGDVNVYGTVAGNIKTTSGDVHVENGALGDVTTVSGDVRAATIEGNVKSVSGDISRR